MVICLDPAAPYGGELPERSDITYFVTVNRGHGPGNPAYRYTEIQDIGGLPGVVGL